MAPASPWLIAIALLLAPQQEAGRADPARVQALYAAARYGEALEEAAHLSDPVLAAEWRVYLFMAGGDLPAALQAASEGLALEPQHRGLLVNAASVALTLGLAGPALDHTATLESLVDQDGESATKEERERAERLGLAARELARLDAAGRGGRRAARVVVVLGLAAVVAAMLALALRPVQR